MSEVIDVQKEDCPQSNGHLLKPTYEQATDYNFVFIGSCKVCRQSNASFDALARLKPCQCHPFTHSVSEAYGVLTELNGQPIALRTTFIIGRDGVIKEIFRDVDVTAHTQRVIDAIKGMA